MVSRTRGSNLEGIPQLQADRKTLETSNQLPDDDQAEITIQIRLIALQIKQRNLATMRDSNASGATSHKEPLHLPWTHRITRKATRDI